LRSWQPLGNAATSNPASENPKDSDGSAAVRAQTTQFRAVTSCGKTHAASGVAMVDEFSLAFTTIK
jgi:hypothetical protein